MLGLSITADARGDRMRMINCTTVFRTPEQAMKYLVMDFDTLHFTPGERIADIGASGAHMPGWLSLFYKDLDITLEDLDSGCLNKQQINYVMQYYANINKGLQPENIRSHVVIGNDSSATLPDAAYQKVFLINTHHEITKPAPMAADLYRITAPGGSLYILETVSSTVAVRRRDCPHMVAIENDLLNLYNHAGFRLVKTNVTRNFKIRAVAVRICGYHFVKD